MSIEAAKLANYRSSRGASAYLHDHRTKRHRRWSDRVERRILRRFLAELGPLDRAIDVPCGFGRLLPLLHEHAAKVAAADVSPSMLELCRELGREQGRSPDPLLLECSALELPLAERAFDLVLSVRLNHHLSTPEAREAHVRELCRVAGRAVIFTFFSQTSLKSRLRAWRARFTSKRAKLTLHPRRVAELLASCGFELRQRVPLARLGSGHVYVLAERADRSAR